MDSSVFVGSAGSDLGSFNKTVGALAFDIFDGSAFFIHHHDGASRLGGLGNGTILFTVISYLSIWIAGALQPRTVERTYGASRYFFDLAVQQCLCGSRSSLWSAGRDGTWSSYAQAAFNI